jgi:predicted transposase YdaD
MKESVTYQAILEEGVEKGRVEGEAIGRVEEARRTILRIGEKRFGDADAMTRSHIENATELGTLEILIDRLLEVETWEELLREIPTQ